MAALGEASLQRQDGGGRLRFFGKGAKVLAEDRRLDFILVRRLGKGLAGIAIQCRLRIEAGRAPTVPITAALMPCESRNRGRGPTSSSQRHL